MPTASTNRLRLVLLLSNQTAAAIATSWSIASAPSNSHPPRELDPPCAISDPVVGAEGGAAGGCSVGVPVETAGGAGCGCTAGAPADLPLVRGLSGYSDHSF
jgi:hypothetical protein